MSKKSQKQHKQNKKRKQIRARSLQELPKAIEEAEKLAEPAQPESKSDYNAIEEIPEELEAGLNQEDLTLKPFDAASLVADILKKQGS